MSTRPSLEAALALLLAAAGAAHAADALDLRAERERQRSANERGRIEEQYQKQVRQCQAQFVVTSCMDDAKAQRRQALERLAQQQGVLDDAMRKQRAAERLENLQEKQREASQKRSATQPRVVQRSQKAPAPAASTGSAASHALTLPASRAELSATERQQNRSAYEEKQRAAAAHRETVEQRNKAHAAEHKPAAPLPVPASIPASAP